MPNQPSITVIIPTYNRREQLRRALYCLSCQTDSDFDVFVCDDGSSEDIQSVIDEFSNKLAIAWKRIPNSGGPARPRNIGLANAQGTWVSFLDSDDWWLPSRMKTIKQHLGKDVDVIYHSLSVTRSPTANHVGPNSAIIGQPLRCADPLNHMLRFGNPLPTSATIVRTSLMLEICGFDESGELAFVEDFDAWLRLATKGARFRYVQDVLGFYWVGEDNNSALTKRHYEHQCKLFERHLSLLPLPYLRRARSNFNYLLGRYEMLLGLPNSGRLTQVEFTCEPLRWLKARLMNIIQALINPRRPS